MRPPQLLDGPDWALFQMERRRMWPVRRIGSVLLWLLGALFLQRVWLFIVCVFILDDQYEPDPQWIEPFVFQFLGMWDENEFKALESFGLPRSVQQGVGLLAALAITSVRYLGPVLASAAVTGPEARSREEEMAAAGVTPGQLLLARSAAALWPAGILFLVMWGCALLISLLWWPPGPDPHSLAGTGQRHVVSRFAALPILAVEASAILACIAALCRARWVAIAVGLAALWPLFPPYFAIHWFLADLLQPVWPPGIGTGEWFTAAVAQGLLFAILLPVALRRLRYPK